MPEDKTEVECPSCSHVHEVAIVLDRPANVVDVEYIDLIADGGVEVHDHDGDEPRDVVCPSCGEQGFDAQGHVVVEGTRMFLRQCWNCGKRFAVEDDNPIRPDGGVEPGVDISIAPNYRDGCVWVEMPGHPRKCISPDKAREIARKFAQDDRLPLDGSDGFETGKFVQKMRDMANAVEDAQNGGVASSNNGP